MDTLFAAGIVLYNADVGRLYENINAIINQCDHVYLVDNGSENLSNVLNNTFPMSETIRPIF